MKAPGDILIERDGSIAHITLRNPTRKNAISVPMWNAIGDFCRTGKSDPTLRAIVISGEGDTFSAGADLSGGEGGRASVAAKDYEDLVESTISQLEEIPQLVFAAITGPCMGAGASLAISCDFRICERNAFFALPIARVGLGYDPRGVARWVRIFGVSMAKEISLLAARIPAQRAYDVGAVHRLVETNQALMEAKEMAAQAAMLAPLTQATTKATIREVSQRPPPSEEILKRVAAVNVSEDYAEGRAAFAEKRKPDFKGR